LAAFNRPGTFSGSFWSGAVCAAKGRLTISRLIDSSNLITDLFKILILFNFRSL
jgi:hypothetical protein